MRQIVEPVDQARSDAVLQRPRKTEAFVHRDPGDDAGVILIALDGGSELIHQSLLRLRGVLVKVGHLGPDQEAKPIRPVEPAGVFNFLVLARPVEAERLRELDVVTEIGVGCGRVPTAGKVSLVQHQSLNVGLAIQQETPVARPDRAQPEITFDSIEVAAAIVHEPDRELIEHRTLRTPAVHFRKGQSTTPVPSGTRADGPSLPGDVELDAGIPIGRSHLELQRALVEPGPEAEGADMTLRHWLEPDRLPDAGRGRVEDPFRFLLPCLFAPWQAAIGCRVVGPHHQLVVPATRHGGDVDAERGVAALVPRHLDVIDPDGRRVIDRTKMEDQPIRVRAGEATPVPDGIVERALADARERGLIGEGHDDRSIEVGCVKAELPGAIEARPMPPAQPRARVLGTRSRRQCLSPSDGQRLNVRRMGTFPDGFLFGTAQSAHQVEGGNVNSDWWAWEHASGTACVEPSGDACDFYHRYGDDLVLMAGLGLNALRFGIEWARIEPEEGEFSRAALDHYRRILLGCREHGLAAIVTFHHFTLPRWLQAKGGFVFGVNPPGRKGDIDGMWRVAGNVLEAHRRGAAVIRAEAHVPAGVTLALPDLQYEDGATPGAHPLELNARVSDQFFELARDDDFVGVQTYTRNRFGPQGLRGPHAELGKRLPPEQPDTTQLGQEVYPQALGNTIRRAWQRTGGTPILVTESGIATAFDEKRIRYVDAAMREVLACLAAGIEVRSYLYWSLLDNFEWSLGYGPTFGMVAVDRQTFARRPKPSAHWFGEVARARALPDPLV